MQDECKVQWCTERTVRGSVYCASHTRDHCRIKREKDKAGETMPDARTQANTNDGGEA